MVLKQLRVEQGWSCLLAAALRVWGHKCSATWDSWAPRSSAWMTFMWAGIDSSAQGGRSLHAALAPQAGQDPECSGQMSAVLTECRGLGWEICVLARGGHLHGATSTCMAISWACSAQFITLPFPERLGTVAHGLCYVSVTKPQIP